MARPATGYARSGDVNIAYQVFGAGEVDLVLVPGWVSHLEFGWQGPWYEAYLERLARFARVILFDKRGTGMSDRVAVGSLEERMDDIRAVMDAVESRQAVLYAISEGGPLAILFAASHSDRVSALVIYGSFARMTATPDYPIGVPSEQWREQTRFTEANWPVVRIDLWAPSLADNTAFQQWVAALRRHGASPGAARSLMDVIGDIDVRPVLPVIDAPALVLHRRGDRTVPIEMGRVIAEGLPNARWVELEGGDHFPWVGDVEALVGEIEQFSTGRRVAALPERVLATILFADIVDSTRRVAEVGDSRWRELLAAFHRIAEREIGRWKGRLLDTAGDGSSPPSTAPRVRYGARPRSARRRVSSASRSAPGCTPANASAPTANWRVWRSTSGREWRRSRCRATCSSRAPSEISSPAPASNSRSAARLPSKASPASGGCTRSPQPRNRISWPIRGNSCVAARARQPNLAVRKLRRVAER